MLNLRHHPSPAAAVLRPTSWMLERADYVSMVGFLFLDTRVRGSPSPSPPLRGGQPPFYVRRRVPKCDGRVLSASSCLRAIRRWRPSHTSPISPAHARTGESRTRPRRLSLALPRDGTPPSDGAGEPDRPRPARGGVITEHFWATPRSGRRTLEYRSSIRGGVWRRRLALEGELARSMAGRSAACLAASPTSAFLAKGRRSR